MYQLSKREKLLLSILAFIGVLVGIGGLLVKPALDRKLDYEAELGEVQMRQISMLEVLNQREDLTENVEENRQKLKEKAAAYYGPMNTESVGELIVSMLDIYGLNARTMSMTVTMPTAISSYIQMPASYTYSYLENLKQAGEASLLEGITGGDGEVAALDTVQILCSTVTGEALGENSAIRSFLNSVESNSSMQMKTFAITLDDRTGSYVINYSIDVYMLNQISDVRTEE